MRNCNCGAYDTFNDCDFIKIARWKMFEKEAEEYREKGKREGYYLVSQEMEQGELDYIIDESFKDGAEFGYNKANEWHYVKDGDLPKVYQKCYFIYSNFYGEDNKVIFSESSIRVLTGIYAFILDEETGEETTEPCFYDDINDDEINLKEVYAWKEIVLPKELAE
jgi:hypothetical protein